jgi:hypothetical protein
MLDMFVLYEALIRGSASGPALQMTMEQDKMGWQWQAPPSFNIKLFYNNVNTNTYYKTFSLIN